MGFEQNSHLPPPGGDFVLGESVEAIGKLPPILWRVGDAQEREIAENQDGVRIAWCFLGLSGQRDTSQSGRKQNV